jgi:hypothetical protein
MFDASYLHGPLHLQTAVAPAQDLHAVLHLRSASHTPPTELRALRRRDTATQRADRPVAGVRNPSWTMPRVQQAALAACRRISGKEAAKEPQPALFGEWSAAQLPLGPV